MVLVHCEPLFESLYDLLNQHYSSYGGQLYVRLAFGTHSRLCPIHENFRVVVLVEKKDAYEKLAPPLLNRFEKQVLERQDVLLPEDRLLAAKLADFAAEFAAAGATGAATGAATEAAAGGGGKGGRRGGQRGQGNEGAASAGSVATRAAFCGWHTDLLASLILSVRARGGPAGAGADDAATGTAGALTVEMEGRMLSECLDRLLWIASPERVCRVLSADGGAVLAALKDKFGVDVGKTYFGKQRHSSMPSLAATMLEEWTDDAVGCSAIVTTYAPLTAEAPRSLAEAAPWAKVRGPRSDLGGNVSVGN